MENVAKQNISFNASPFKRATIWPTRAPFKPKPILTQQAPYLIKFTSLQALCWWAKKKLARGLHGLSCRKSTPRHQRHAMLNDLIWRAIKRAHIPAHKERISLVTQDGKRPDGATLIPWSKGKALDWDVTVPDTYADSHISRTSLEAGAAAKQAASLKHTSTVTLPPPTSFTS